MPDVDEHQADIPAPDAPDEPAVSWGPTFGPETEADATRPSPKPARRGWHPPGGFW